jgi:hypothetical protein
MPAQLQSTQYFIPSAKCFNNKTHLLAELMDDNCFITFMALLYTFPTYVLSLKMAVIAETCC